MSIHYENLDPEVRRSMIDELDADIAAGSLYVSPRLTDDGAKAWPSLLDEAFGQGDDVWLEARLRDRRFIRATEPRRLKDRVIDARVPVTAPETLAEGEFNRFYARGLCVSVLASGGTEVEVYRGKEVQKPRAQSQAMIGCRVLAQQLLDDLRTSQGVEPALGLPPGPNSGLTIRRVTD